jgi:hypothetical protein
MVHYYNRYAFSIKTAMKLLIFLKPVYFRLFVKRLAILIIVLVF